MGKSVCIIGAGPSGLVAAKTFLQTLPSAAITIYDPLPRVGGLWPSSPADENGRIHPLMVANQSRHTVHFSDLAWDDDAPQLPKAWQVGEYLHRYHARFLDGRVQLSLRTEVVRTTQLEDGSWKVRVRKRAGGAGKGGQPGESADEEKRFDCVVVASGFFGQPIVHEQISRDAENGGVPLVHSCYYRDLEILLGKGGARRKGGKILVAGGQMSGVEIAATIATHVSSARHTPDAPSILDADSLTVHHLVQRPVWVFPLYTSPRASLKAAPFAPLDLSSYNLNNRPSSLGDAQGRISENAARNFHAIYQSAVGTAQTEYSPHLSFDDEAVRTKPPFMAVSDHYLNLAREGVIDVHSGKLESLDGNKAILDDGSVVEDVAAVVLATGFDPSPCLGFLPRDVLETLKHDPSQTGLPVALAFHATHHPAIINLGFVGFYRSPYWGVMEMQARLVASILSGNTCLSTNEALENDDGIKRTLALRSDPRCSQFPMGDYAFVMSDFSIALNLPISEPISRPALLPLPHNDKPIDFLSPSRYSASPASSETQRSLFSAHTVIDRALTTPLFVARGIFRSLLGTWNLDRVVQSRLPSHPSGTFAGTGTFYLRAPTREPRQCVPGAETFAKSAWTEEYLYVEDGLFRAATNRLEFRATRRYVWRYDESRDVVSVWFVKAEDPKRVDYLFHELELEAPERKEDGWKAKAGHLCVQDYYDVKYEFDFMAINLERWSVEYGVKGPAKDYTIRGEYRRG